MANPQISAYTDKDCLGTDDAVAISQKLRSGEVNAEELTQTALQRLEKVDAKLHATVCLRRDEVIAEAQAWDANPIYNGFGYMPSFLKDNLDLKGLPTRHGSEATPKQPKKESSPLTKQFENIGLRFLGKTTLPEFGLTATTESTYREDTRNPWNLAYSTGGSSGGSAALVAAGVVPLAHANDGGGSIRIPAACCGLVGFKPSRGRLIDNEMAKDLPINMVSDGMVTRSVRDTAYFFAHAERAYKNPTLAPLGLVEPATIRPLKIAFFTDMVFGGKAHQEVVKAVETAAHQLEKLGHIIEEVPIPVSEQFAEDFLLYWGLLAFSVKYAGKWVVDKGFDARKVEPLTHGLAGHFMKNLHKGPFAIRRLKQFQREYNSLMAGFDVLLSPTLASPPPPIGHLGLDLPFDLARQRLFDFASYTAAQNIAGAPAISLPTAISNEGLPVAIHLTARSGADRLLLEIAYQVESYLGFPTVPRNPKLNGMATH